jgi:hypothetical protein
VTFPSSAFYLAPFLLYELLSIPGVLLATIIFTFTQAVVPYGSAANVFSARADMKKAVKARLLPMMVISYGHNLSFRYSPETTAGDQGWIGPDDGKARQGLRALKSLLFTIWVSSSLYILFLGTIIIIIAKSS